MCSDAPAAPDYTPLANAMKEVGDKMYSLGQEQLSFGRQRYQETLPLYQKMIGQDIQGQQLAMDLAKDAAKERLKYRALEDEILTQTRRFNQNQQADIYAGRAGADVEGALAQQRTVANRNLTRMGINPNSARFAALNNQFALSGAAGKAGAMTNARMAAENQGLALKYQAANLGRGLPGTALSAIGTGVGAGAGAHGLIQGQNAPMYQGFSGAMGGLQGQMNTINSQANMLNMGFQNQMAGYQAEQSAMAGMGQVAGMAAMAFSSEDYKKDKTPIKDGAALHAVNNMEVESWNYKPGIADGGSHPHVGTYAEQFKRETGLGDGKMLPLQDALGVTMKAVQDLDKKVSAMMRVERKANGGTVRGGKNRDGRGGAIKGPGTGTSDSVKAVNKDNGRPIALSTGEYIIPEDTVRKVGKETLDRLVKDTHTPVRNKAIGRA